MCVLEQYVTGAVIIYEKNIIVDLRVICVSRNTGYK